MTVAVPLLSLINVSGSNVFHSTPIQMEIATAQLNRLLVIMDGSFVQITAVTIRSIMLKTMVHSNNVRNIWMASLKRH